MIFAGILVIFAGILVIFSGILVIFAGILVFSPGILLVFDLYLDEGCVELFGTRDGERQEPNDTRLTYNDTYLWGMGGWYSAVVVR